MKWLLVFICTTCVISLSAFSSTFDLKRTDGSSLRVYLETPLQQPSFSIVILFQGSTCTSSFPLFSRTAPILLKSGIAVLAVEKYGLDENSIDCPDSYLQNNTVQARILDYLQIASYIRQNVIGWNKKLGLVGGSEGGQVASLVAPLIPETSALVTLAAGGGMTMAEELPIVVTKSMKRSGTDDLSIQRQIESINQHFTEIKSNPISTIEWLSDGKTARNTYKYWNSILWLKALPLLESLNTPIYIAHGTEDTSCPYESSKLISDRFEELGKKNLVFKSYPGLEHNMSELNGTQHMQEVFGDALQWMVSKMN